MSIKCSFSIDKSFMSVNDKLWYLFIGSKYYIDLYIGFPFDISICLSIGIGKVMHSCWSRSNYNGSLLKIGYN